MPSINITSADVTAIIVSVITVIVGPILIILIRHFMKNSQADIVQDNLRTGTLIDNKIDDIRSELHADRVWVAQFHNGGHFYPSGKSIAKFSIFHETVGIGVQSMQIQLQNIPVNLFSKSLNELSERDQLVAVSGSNSNDSMGIRHLLDEYGSKVTYLSAIRSIDGRLIGMLGVDYTKSVTMLSQTECNSLLLSAASIGGIITTGL